MMKQLVTLLAFPIAACGVALGCSSSTATLPGGGGSGGTGGGGGGGASSSCSSSDGCGADEYCDFPDDRCGAGEAGTCAKRPNFCSDGALIVCSCDGKVEYAGCESFGGFDANVDASACTEPGGVVDDVFPCGDRFCLTGISYCQLSVSDVGGVPDSYSCELLPSSCASGGSSPTCACLAGEPCGSLCDDAGAGALTLTCPGG